MTDTSLPKVKLVGGSADTLDPRLKHVDSVTLSKRSGHLHAARRDSDHLAPVGRRHDSFNDVERNIARNITRGTDVRKQEVLDRFFRVRGNNVENC